ncbi:hypothetical protein B0A55_03429 [Friedmanniomyces simplex]|uniref:P-type phospholipid transporter n=1 Tax=Friedmanniomyces simplex TaxID=329884 RepID=A0A4V5NHV4_9PEZI|nr:hypothetical protein B0A55_03429 [Friedmanniomyces simplex]
MTSVLARLGQLETRTALGSIWRPKKRKREEWICRRCRGRQVQWRGYSDESLKGTVGDYLFPPAKQERKEGVAGLRINPEWGGRERGRPQPTYRGDFGAEREREREGYGVGSSLDAPTPPTDDDPEWASETTRDYDPAAPHERAQNVLWERFERTGVFEANASEKGRLALEDDLATSEQGQDFVYDNERDASLLDIDYAATLPQALARRESDLTARCLFAAANANDLDFVRALPDGTFSDVLTVLEPANFITRLASANLEMSEATRKLIGTAPMGRVAAEYSHLVSEIVAMRRSGGEGLSVSDYAILLRSARDLGNRNLSESLWRKMPYDSCVPTTECYNYYMSSRVFHEFHNSQGNHKIRVIPANMLARKDGNPSAAYQSYRVGTGGLKDEVMAIFREMLSNGAIADEESFRIVITAAAREGELVTVKSVLRKVWNIDVDAMLGGTPEAVIAPKQFPQDSPLLPTEKLLFAIAHAFAINNDIPTALRLVDFVARHYNLTISQETWAQLFEWTFVLAVPRTGVKAAYDGTRTGKLPLQSVMNLWQTMTGAPYHIAPTMGMYNHLIKNLLYRDMSHVMVEKMEEGRLLYRQSVADAKQRWGALARGVFHQRRGEPVEMTVEHLRREWEYAELRRKRNVFWCKRWLRLLLGSSRAPARLVAADSLVYHDIPRLLWRWQQLAPRLVRYETATGLVEFAIRSQGEIDRSNEVREAFSARRERWLEEVPRYIGNEWLRVWRRVSSATAQMSSRVDMAAESNRVKQDWPHPKLVNGLAPEPDELDGQDTETLHAEIRAASALVVKPASSGKMADDATAGGGEGEGMRRRRSAQQDSEEEGDMGRSDELHIAEDRLSEQSQPVRFSEEVEQRPSLGMAKKRKSDEMLHDINGAHEQPYGPALSAVTRAAAIMAGDSVPNAPLGVSSASTPSASSAGTRSRRTPGAPRSSARKRDRGMSLRSSLFTKSYDRRANTDDAIVEMQPVGPSTSAASRPQTAKSGKTPSVTVSPVVDSESSSSSSLSKPSFLQKDMPAASALPNYQRWVQRQADRHLPMRRVKEAYRKGRKFLLRIQEIPPSKDGRHILLDTSRSERLVDERTGRPHIDNTIRSSKYTVWNFLPKQLFAQFGKLANFYFLTVSTLQMVPGLSTTGTYTTIVPLLFFVSISMAKEGYEDLRRHRLDKCENNSMARVLGVHRAAGHDLHDGPVHWVLVKWRSLQVGDIVKLHRDEPAPADLVLLKSAGANNLAYVETMALDGETNLKPKQPPASLIKAYDSEDAIIAGRVEFIVEDPNLDLYNFEGKVTTGDSIAPLTNNEVLYRGSILRNTPDAIGAVIYSGEECKIRMNANKNPRIKAPSLQAIVNKIVLIIVCFVIFLALFNTIAYRVWHGTTEIKAWYLTRASVPFGHILVSFIIMFNTMIPLSLYVSMEIIKVAQMLLLNLDVDMYDEVSDTPLEARTSTINEELGQVSYIFSDKTGTLTENVMQFRKLSVAGTAWLHDMDPNRPPAGEDMLRHKKRKPEGKGKKPLRWAPRKSGLQDQHNGNAGKGSQRQSLNAQRTAQHELPTADMIRYIQRRPHTVFARKAKIMILSMALCHTCLPERDGDGDDALSYQASSPDELALVQAARDLGFVAYERDIATLVLKTYPNGLLAPPEYERYEVLDVIEFSSKRKRMSIVVRFPDGRICLMCKGADSAVMQRLRLAGFAQQKSAEVETRVNLRRSIEAQQALHRKSSVGSFPRTSLQMSRPSMARPSISRLGPIRDDIDGWLTEREHDVTVPRLDERHYSPRPSAQLGRPSAALSESGGSSLGEPDDGELVEDSLAANDAVVIERCLQHINDFATDGLRTLLYGYRFLDDDEYRVWKKSYHDATTSLVNRQQRIEEAGELIEQQLELGGATAIEDKLQRGVPETIDRLRRANIRMWMLTGDKRETAINIGHSCRLIKDYSSVTVLDHETGDVEHKIAAFILEINKRGVAHAVVVVDGHTLSTVEADAALHALFLELAILADSVICCRASPSQKAGLVHAIRRRIRHSVTLAIGDGANDIAMIQEAHGGIGITGKEGLQAARVSDYSIAQFRFLTKLLLVHGRWNYIRTCKYTVGTFWKELLFYLTQALYQRSAGYTGTSLYESWSLSMFNTLFTSLVVIFLGIFEQDLHASTLIAVPELYTKGQRSGGFNFRIYLGWMFMAASQAMISLYPLGDMTFTACVIIIAIKLQVIEQRYRTYMAALGLFLAIGGWLLWNLILAVVYHSSTNPEYYVKGSLFHAFGRNALWWLVLLLTVTTCLAYEVAVRALKHAFFPTDVETFQTLEQGLDVRKRFEEASAAWLQAGWRHGSGKGSAEVEREAEEQARREGEVQELLDKPRVMEEGRVVAKGGVKTAEEVVVAMVPGGVRDGRAHDKGNVEMHEMLSRQFGDVRRESLARP